MVQEVVSSSITGLPRSMTNADQNFGIDPNVDQFQADQCRSMPDQAELN